MTKKTTSSFPRLASALGGLCLAAGLACSPFAAAASLDDLLNAAKLGDANEIARDVAQGMDPDSSDPSGNTLLILAAREEQPAAVAELLRHRVRLNARNAAGDTALMLAALKGNLPIVDQLLQAGAAFDHNGWNPLLYAAFEGRLPVVERLLKQGANPDALAPNRTTPLLLAARNGHLEVVRRLLAAGVDIDWKNDRGETAESLALAQRNTDIAELIRAERKARAERRPTLQLQIE